MTRRVIVTLCVMRSALPAALGGGPQQVGYRILATQAKGTDDALVSAARYLGGRS